MDLSIIIVSYNSENTIKDCIDSVLNTIKKHSFEIIVSDNSENEITNELISKEYGKNSKLVYIKNDSNLGFSKANNVGIKQSKGEFVLFLNPDTKVYEKTVDGMIEFMKKNPDCGVSTCFVELPGGKLDQASHRGFPTPLRSLSYFTGLSKFFSKNKLLGGYSMLYKNMEETHEIDSAAGSFMLVPRKVGNRIKWWDEDYFFYGEDLDFCFRVKELGYKVYFVPEFKALHLKGVSSGIKKESMGITKASNRTKNLAMHHRFKAMEIFYDKHYKNKYPGFLRAFIIMGIKFKRAIS